MDGGESEGFFQGAHDGLLTIQIANDYHLKNEDGFVKAT
jgi:hypothetical protein